MILMNEIPDRFWSLFRSVNRSTYIEALLKINEEYEYSNYFLSREVCIQLLSEYFSRKKYVIWQDETEDDWDELEPPATRVLNWLLRTGWLRKVRSDGSVPRKTHGICSDPFRMLCMLPWILSRLGFH